MTLYMVNPAKRWRLGVRKRVSNVLDSNQIFCLRVAHRVFNGATLRAADEKISGRSCGSVIE
jgi:hypothetical protein